jgi:hypothetical protein
MAMGTSLRGMELFPVFLFILRGRLLCAQAAPAAPFKKLYFQAWA